MKLCSVKECSKKYHGRGMCRQHYNREYRKNNKKKRNEYMREWHHQNKDKRNEYQRKRYYDNKQEEKERKRLYYLENKEKILERCRKYRKNNKKKLNEYQYIYRNKNKERVNERTRKNEKKRYGSDIQYKLRHVLRVRLHDALKGRCKSGSAVQDLGCPVDELKKHLEAQFQSGMTWDNWSTDGWHVDHIVPLSRFDLTNRDQLLKAIHFTNLQPLWAEDNLKKGNK